ncbi:tetratricopeptide repeat protein [Verrucomicrobiota bacterium]
MRKLISFISLFFSFLIVSTNIFCELHGAEPNDKAKKYLQVLTSRPTSGYLFDRFHNAWAETSSVHELEEYLKLKSRQDDGAVYNLLLAFFYEKEGEEDQALQMYNKALDQQFNPSVVLYHKANMELYMLSFEDSIKNLERALNLKPPLELRTKIIKLLGKVYSRNGDDAKAIKVWRSLAESAPDDIDLKEDIIELAMTEGLLDEAIEDCRALIKVTKDKYKTIMLHLQLGDIYQHAGKKEDALEAYQSILANVGSGSWIEQEILSQIERVFRAEDDLTGLQDYFKEVMVKYPKRADIVKRYAFLQHETGNTDSAIKAFVDLIKITPGDRDNREKYVKLLTEGHKYEEAIKQAEELIKQYPEDKELLLTLGSVQHKAKKDEDACETLKRYLAQSEKNEFEYLRVARIFKNYDMKDAAAETYRKLAEVFSESLSAREACASYLFSAGAREEAKKIILTDAGKLNVDEIIRVADSLHRHGESQSSFDLLKNREEEFGKQFNYISQLYRISTDMGKKKEALSYAIRCVNLSKRISELETALSSTATAAKNAEQSEALIEKLSAKTDKGFGSICLLAELLERSGAIEQVDDIINKALEKKPDSALILGQKLRIAKRRRDWEQAIETTRNLLKIQPAKRSIFVQELVDYSLNANAHDKAMYWLNEWKKAAPNSPAPYIKEARIHSDNMELPEAITSMRSAVLKFPDRDEVREQLAALYETEGSYEEAARIYWHLLEKAEDLSKKLVYVRNISRSSEIQGKSDRLIRHFKTRRETNPKSVFPLLALANIYRDIGNYEERRKHLIEAAQMKSEDIQLLHEIARIEEQEGDYYAAIATLNRAAGFDKTDRSKEKLARIYMQSGEEDKGYDLILKIAGGTKMDPATAERVADTLIAAGQFERVASLLQDIHNTHPNDYRIGYLYGIALEELHKYDEAIHVFTRLLGIRKEIARLTSKKTIGAIQAHQNYWANYRDILPKEASDLLRSASYQHTAYSYKQARSYGWGGGYGYYYSSYAQRQTVNLPSSVEDMPHYAIWHLNVIAQNLDDDKKQDLITALRETGISYPELKMEIQPLQNQQMLWDKILDKYPDDENMKCLWAFSCGTTTDNKEKLKEVYSEFKTKRPQLAVLVALSTLHNPNMDEALIKDALEILKSIDKPNIMLIQSLNSLAYYNPSLSGEKLSTNLIQDISGILLKTYKDHKDNPQISYGVLSSALSLLLKTEDYEKVITLLDDMMQNYSQTGKKSGYPLGYYPGRYMGRRYGKLAAGFAFPPFEVLDMPPVIYQILQSYRYGNTQAPIDIDKLKPYAEKAKHPLLKMILAVMIEDDEFIKKAVEGLIEEEKPVLGHLIFSAAWKAEQDELIEAIKILERARHMQMNQQMRKSIDGAIVAWALATEETTDKEAFKAGRKAALRLKRQTLNRQERGELANILDEFGLEEEAEKIDQMLAKAMTLPASPYGMSRSYQPSSRNQIDALLKSGEKDKALKMLIKDFRNVIKPLLSINTIQHGHSSVWQLRQIKETLSKNNMGDDFLKEIDPGPESKNTLKLLEKAYSLEMLDKTDEALSVYNKVIEIKPTDIIARFRSVMILAEKNPDKAVEQLRTVDKRWLFVLGTIISQELNSQQKISKKLAQLPIVLTLIDLIKDQKNLQQPYWIMNILSCFENSVYENNIRLPHIFEKAVELKKEGMSKESLASLMVHQKRLEAYYKLCDAALSLPMIGEQVFPKKLAACRINNQPIEDFIETAKDLIKKRGENRNPMFAQMGYINYGHYSINGKSVHFEGPEEFLTGHWYEHGNTNALSAFLAELKDNKHTISRKRLEKLRDLYEATPEQFIETAKEFMKNSGNPSMQGMGADANTFRIVIKAWKSGKKETSLTPLVLETAEQLSKRQYYNDISFIMGWSKELAEHKGEKATVDLLNSTCKIMLGKILDENGTKTLNAVEQQRVRTYQNLLNVMAREKSLILPVITHIQAFPSLCKLTGNNSFFYSMRDSICTWDVLRKLPVTREWNEFRAFSLGESGSLLSGVADALRSNKDKDAWKKLNEIKPRTFGMGLLIILGERKGLKDIYEYLGNYLEEISSSEPERKKDLFGALSAYTRRYSPVSSSQLSGNAQKFHEIQQAFQQSESLENVDDFLGQKTVNEMFNEDNFRQNAVNIIIPLLQKKETAKAEEIFNHTIKTLKKHQRRISGYSRYSGSYTPPSALEELIDEIGERADSIEAFAFLLPKIQGKEIIGRNLHGELYSRFNSIVTASYQGKLDVLKKELSITKDEKDPTIEDLSEKQQQHFNKIFQEMSADHKKFQPAIELPEDDKGRTATVSVRKKGKKIKIHKVHRNSEEVRSSTGEYIRVRAFKETFNEIASALGDLHPPFMSSSLDYTVLGNFSKQEFEDIMIWLKDEKTRPIFLYALAHAEMARANKGKRYGKYVQPEAPIQYYIKVIVNQELSPSWRLGVAYALSRDSRWSPATDQFSAPVAIVYTQIDRKNRTHFKSFANQNLMFLKDAEKTVEWENAVNIIYNDWRRENATKGIDQLTVQSSDMNTALAMFEIQLRLNNEEHINAILSMRWIKPAWYPPTYAVLLKHDKLDLAVDQFKSQYKHIGYYHSYPNGFSMTPETRNKVDDFVAKTSSADLKMQAKATFAIIGTHNPAMSQNNEIKPDQELLKSAAEEFKAHEFTDNEAQKRCRIALLREPNFELLKEHLVKLCDDRSLAFLLKNRNGYTEPQYKAYLKFMLDDGNIEKFKEKLNELISIPGNQNSSNFRYTLNLWKQSLGLHFMDTKNKQKYPIPLEKYLDCAKLITKHTSRWSYSYDKDFFKASLILHYAIGAKDETAEWHKQTKAKTSYYKGKLQQHEINRVFVCLINSVPQDNRVNIYKGCRELLTSEDGKIYVGGKKIANPDAFLIGSFKKGKNPLPPELEQFKKAVPKKNKAKTKKKT